MSKRRRKPGRLFWAWTFAVGIGDPRKGQRRIDARLRDAAQREEEYERQLAAHVETIRLRDDRILLLEGKLREMAEADRARTAAIEMAEGVRELEAVRAAATRTDDTSGATSTMPLCVDTCWGTTDPGVINTRPENTGAPVTK